MFSLFPLSSVGGGNEGSVPSASGRAAVRRARPQSEVGRTGERGEHVVGGGLLRPVGPAPLGQHGNFLGIRLRLFLDLRLQLRIRDLNFCHGIAEPAKAGVQTRTAIGFDLESRRLHGELLGSAATKLQLGPRRASDSKRTKPATPRFPFPARLPEFSGTQPHPAPLAQAPGLFAAKCAHPRLRVACAGQVQDHLSRKSPACASQTHSLCGRVN
jgi:hypothetical protein